MQPVDRYPRRRGQLHRSGPDVRMKMGEPAEYRRLRQSQAAGGCGRKKMGIEAVSHRASEKEPTQQRRRRGLTYQFQHSNLLRHRVVTAEAEETLPQRRSGIFPALWPSPRDFLGKDAD